MERLEILKMGKKQNKSEGEKPKGHQFPLAQSGETSGDSKALDWNEIQQRLKQKGVSLEYSDTGEVKCEFRQFNEASLKLIAELESSGEALTKEALNDWVKLWIKLKGGASDDQGIAREFFAFNAGPMDFGRRFRQPDEILPLTPGQPPKDVLRAQPVQKVFLAPDSWRDSPNPFERFAQDFALNQKFEGVHLLAGVRGSGKSTLLNRVAWHCRAFDQDGSNPPPLLTRIDIGTSFDERKFTIDLASQICQDAKRRLKQPPYCGGPLRRAAVMLTGHLGRWCSSNLRWSSVAIVLLGLFVLVEIIHDLRLRQAKKELPELVNNAIDITVDKGPPKDDLKKIEEYLQAADRLTGNHKKPPDEFSSQARVVFFVLSSMLFLGLLYNLSEVRRKSKAPSRGDGGLRVSCLMNSCIALCIGTIFAMAVSEAFLGAPPWMDWLDPRNSSLRLITGVAAIVVLVLALGMFLLPNWIGAYFSCQRLFLALRARQDESAPDLPYISNITTLIRAMVPHGDDNEPMDELSVPMLQNQMKKLLMTCVSAFGRVVILIDDVDVLPSEKFHELMRIVRPATKVPGVCCLISVPEYFYYEFYCARLGDLHSTVQEVYFLGDPILFRGHSERFESRTEMRKNGKDADQLTKGEFLQLLAKMLAGRFRLELNSSLALDKPLTSLNSVPKVFEYLLAPWEKLISSEPSSWQTRVGKFLSQVGQSRREWFREMDRTTRRFYYGAADKEGGFRTYTPLGFLDDDGSRAWDRRANERKARYGRDESALVARKTAPKPHPSTIAVEIKKRPEHIITVRRERPRGIDVLQGESSQKKERG